MPFSSATIFTMTKQKIWSTSKIIINNLNKISSTIYVIHSWLCTTIHLCIVIHLQPFLFRVLWQLKKVEIITDNKLVICCTPNISMNTWLYLSDWYNTPTFLPSFSFEWRFLYSRFTMVYSLKYVTMNLFVNFVQTMVFRIYFKLLPKEFAVIPKWNSTPKSMQKGKRRLFEPMKHRPRLFHGKNRCFTHEPLSVPHTSRNGKQKGNYSVPTPWNKEYF